MLQGQHRKTTANVLFWLKAIQIRAERAVPFCNAVAAANFAASKAPGRHYSTQPGRGLTWRSTGPIAAGRHLGYKSLAQTPARRNRPVSLYVRPHRMLLWSTVARNSKTGPSRCPVAPSIRVSPHPASAWIKGLLPLVAMFPHNFRVFPPP